jgi:hypothetical protein
MRRLAGLLILLTLVAGAPARAAPPVDLALVLAVDASRSVDSEEFDLQRLGYAKAFRNPRVIDAIRGGSIGSIAVTYFQWSGPQVHYLAVPWSVLRDKGDIAAFADAVEHSDRVVFGGGTSVSGAIDFGVALLAEVPAEPARRVIDISGDGSNNNGRLPTYARDEAVAAGITINGLAILNDEPLLDRYYFANVIGGPGSFVVTTNDYETFAAAILTKLIREIAYNASSPDRSSSPERSNSSTSRTASSSEMP